MSTPAPSLAAYGPMTLTTLIWGTMSVPASYAIAHFQPMALVAFRCLVAVVVLSPYVWRTQRKLTPSREDLVTVILMGLVGVFANNAFYFYALRRTSIMNISIIFSTAPLITAVLARIFCGEALGPKRMLGIAAALVGTLLLLTQGQPHLVLQIQFNNGDLAELGAATMASLLAILGKRVRSTSSPMATLYCMLGGLIFSLPAMALTGQGFPDWGASKVGLFSAIYLGVFGSAVAYMTQQISIKKIGASASTAFLNAMPVIGLVSAHLFMGERISAFQVVSAVVIFCGLFLNTQANQQQS